MLKWDVHITAHFRVGGHLFQDILGEISRIGIMDTDPFYTLDGRECAQKLRQSPFLIQVKTVEGRILGDKHQFPYTVGSKAFCLFDKRFDRHGTVCAPDEGDGTVRAAAVAAFRDFQESVGMMPVIAVAPMPVLRLRSAAEFAY